jgi:hypothetical protein
MERRPLIRANKGGALPGASAPKPVILRKHATTAPVPRVARLEPGRILLLPALADRERDALAKVWQKSGGTTRRIRRIWDPDPDLKEQCLCVYGNAIFCQVLAANLELELLGPADDLLSRLPPDLLGRSVRVSRLAEAEQLEYPCFVKSLPAKQFTSGLVSSSQRLRELTSGMEPESGLLVSEMVHFEAHARAFLYDRRVLDCAIYRGHGDLESALETAERVAQLEGTPFGFVVDLGWLVDRWVVLKLKPAWSSRLKGNDPEKVFLSIAAATRA